ncbi:MAG: glucosylceramidase, partial [Bacteroidales bacterium]|nr:glucosylceramidase [Bacteroidales bacterium]
MKRLFKYLIISILAFNWSCSCNNDKPVNPTPDPEPISGEVATLYTTAADGSKVFVKSSSELIDATSASGNVVKITDEKFQTVDGFGAAMTWASCFNLLTMSAENRESFLRELFDVENGLGISLVRVSMGASDFNYEEYTWCDQPGIENFEVDPRDKDVVFPILKEMYKINPKVRIIASPWSCPIWMKRRSVND